MSSRKKGKLRILFVRLSPSSFVQNDLKLLKKHFDVKEVDFILTRTEPKNTLKAIWGMFTGILWADLTFSWFADFHSYWAVKLSKILKKKAIVIVGGYDVVKIPEINYGASLDPKSAQKIKYILENADKILPFSKHSEKEVLNQLKQTKTVETVYLPIDADKFKPSAKKEDMVLTVAIVKDSNLERKGLETFVKSAKYLDNVNFVLIGKQVDESINYLKSIGTPNVNFLGFLNDEELIKYYQKAKVYAQLSAHEGFGVAIAEAMCCECVPVVTQRGSIPEVVGDTGFYVTYGDPEAAAEAIKNALKSDKGKEARNRIIDKFTFKNREDKLLEIINSMNSK